MSTVEKLLIKGIRSFSPDNTTVIEFYKPLTLIVGANGAGKTTIIECLKQACTGELPPNTRSGQSFIHDPKVSNETETKAQIKLRFKNSCGMPVVVLRSFQLTQKAKQLQFKTLDCTVQAIDKATGEKQAMTYRCGDLDKLVPEMMGVSKAVLENVIFVHQEESNWPLSEGKVLKDKFDDIFSATKYTKALEALRKMRSEKVQEAKELKLRLDNVKTHRDVALRLRGEISDGRNCARGFEDSARALDAQIQEKEEAIGVVNQKLVKITQMADSIVRLRTQCEEKTAQAAHLLSRLDGGQDLDETTEEVLQYRADFEVQLANARSDAARAGQQVQSARLQGTNLRDSYQRDCLQHGRMEADAATHATNLSGRDQFIRSTASKLGIAVSDAANAALSAASVASFQQELAAKHKAREVALADLKAINRRKDDSMAAELDAASARMAAATETLRTRKEQRDRNAQMLDSTGREMLSYPVSGAIVEAAKMKERDVKGAWERLQATQASSNLDAALATERQALDDIQRKMYGLRTERDKVASASEGVTRLAILKKDILDKDQVIQSTLLSKRSRLAPLLNVTELPPMEQLRESTDGAVARLRARAQARRGELDSLQKRQQITSGQVGSARAQLTQAEASLATLRRELREGMRVAKGDALAAAQSGVQEDSFAQEYTKVESDTAAMQEKTLMGKAMTTVLEKYRQIAGVHDGCPLCQREFKQGERETCISLIDRELESLPARLAKREATLRRQKAEVAALQALQPRYVRFVDLRDKDLPAARQQVAALEAQLEDLNRQVDDAQMEFGAADVDAGEAQRLNSEVVWTLDRQHQELGQLRDQARRLEALNNAAGGGRSVADVDNELLELESQRTQHDGARDAVMRKRERMQNEIMAAGQAHTVAQSERMSLEDRNRKREACLAKTAELEAANKTLEEQIRSAHDTQVPLVADRDRLHAQRGALRAEATRGETAAEAALRDAVTMSDQYNSLCRVIQAYEGSNKAAELKSMSESIENLRQRVDTNQQDIHKLENAMRDAEAAVVDKDKFVRDLQDTLDYRNAREALQKVETAVLAAEAEAAQVGDSGALYAEELSIGRTARELRTQRDKLLGQLSAVRATMERANKDLAATVYKNIDDEYRSKLIELTATHMGNADLDKYHKALEKALLTFHTTKMEDINKIIKEMWQKTYRGQDIDHIQIKADADGVRSYNYRVVMYSGGAELEMRGRCSAGQKVLACLIIRLALAETFCLNCGILALDEPTTNLDVDNAQALAEELRSIMVARREQSNFQLIVITHDEAFARSIGTHEYADTLWRITKDDSQHSKVSAEAID